MGYVNFRGLSRKIIMNVTNQNQTLAKMRQLSQQANDMLLCQCNTVACTIFGKIEFFAKFQIPDSTTHFDEVANKCNTVFKNR